MIVAVGTKNKVKIQPVIEVFSHHFKDVIVKGIKVESGVGEQPLHDDETFKGALTRAQNALQAVPSASYGVGIEGGVHKHTYGWFEKTIVVIINREGIYGVGISGALALPHKISKAIESGKNLEQAVDSHFGTTQIGESIGMFGLFTNQIVTRSSGIKQAVAFAYARFFQQHIYEVME